MKKSEIIQKVRSIDDAVALEQYEKIKRIEAEMDLENRESNRNRARSVTVGTAFGGTTELMMRSDGGRHIWCVMQPVEVIELIHQLAANVGCHLQLQPRKDFSSWRDWHVTEEEKKHLNGHPPFVNDMAPVKEIGANMDAFETDTLNLKAEKLKQAIAAIEEEHRAANNVEYDEKGRLKNTVILNADGSQYMFGGKGGDPTRGYELHTLKKELDNVEKTMATKKTVNKRTTKRTARAS